MNMDEYLGWTYQDRITGFRGVATAHCIYLTGCDQLLLAAEAKDGKPGESQWIDVQRLTLDAGVLRIVLDNGATPGCDAPAPIR
jgi:hypothetical protein